MDDDNIISEFRNCNQKLMDYFTPEKFEKLIKYITEEPEDENDRLRSYKLPFISCELLTCDIVKVYDVFFNYQEQNQDDNEEDGENDDESGEEEQQSAPPRYSVTSSKHRDFEEFYNQNDNSRVESKTEEENQKDDDQNQEPNDKQKDGDNEGNQDDGREPSEESSSSSVDRSQKESHKNQEENTENRERRDNSLNLSEIEEEQKQKNVQNDEEEANKAIDEENKHDSDSSNNTKKKKKKEKSLSIKEPTYLLDILFNFVSSDKEVNVTLAGYFSKVVNQLYNKKETELVDYVYDKKHIVEDLSKQLHSKSMQEILSKLICFEVTNTKQNYTDIRIKIINSIVNQVKDESEIDNLYNCTQIILDVLNKYQVTNNGKKLYDFLTVDCNQRFVQGLTSGNQQVIICQANIISNMFTSFIQNEARRESMEGDEIEEEIDYQLILQNFIDIVPKLIEFLENQPGNQGYSIETSFKQSIQPFGQARLKIIELILLSIKLKHNQDIITVLCLNNLFSKLMVLFTQYEWNNLLHNLIEKIFITSLTSSSHTLKRSLLVDSNLVGFLNSAVQNTNSSASPQDKPQAFRKGYLGHITSIADNFKKVLENEQEIHNLISMDDWNQFRVTYFDQTYQKDHQELGGCSTISPQTSNPIQVKPEFDKNVIKDKYSNFLNSPRSSIEKLEKQIQQSISATQTTQHEQQKQNQQNENNNQSNQEQEQENKNGNTWTDTWESNNNQNNQEKQESNTQSWDQWDSQNQQVEINQQNKLNSIYDQFLQPSQESSENKNVLVDFGDGQLINQNEVENNNVANEENKNEQKQIISDQDNIENNESNQNKEGEEGEAENQQQAELQEQFQSIPAVEAVDQQENNNNQLEQNEEERNKQFKQQILDELAQDNNDDDPEIDNQQYLQQNQEPEQEQLSQQQQEIKQKSPEKVVEQENQNQSDQQQELVQEQIQETQNLDQEKEKEQNQTN